ncbi:MAG TPA: Ig-like domain repeat protein [Acidobacteriaceae bacterium]
MGELSKTDPMRASARRPGKTFPTTMRVCAALLLAAVSASLAEAQSAAVQLALPSAIVFDTQGNLYFAETGHHVVRELSAAGVLTTVAGTGVQGFAGDNGPATAALLDSPMGLAMDSAGNLYIADSHNHRIRKVSAGTGTISTMAGTGAAGYSGDGGAAMAAQMKLPTALAVDAAGKVFVADTGNHRVREIAASTGRISTVAGNGVEGFAGDGGAATAASMDSPNGLALDGANLYVADTHNGRVRVVDMKTGVISTVAGATGLALPRGLALDAAGNLYVADSANHRVRRISPAGAMTTVAGEGTEAFAGDNAPAAKASLDAPRAVALSPDGLVTLTDSGNQRVRQIDATATPGPDIRTIVGLGVGGSVSGALTLSGPANVPYGGGTVTARLSGAGNATGSITLVDVSGGAPVSVGIAGINAGSAALFVGGLAAGGHSLVAVYAGDASHAAAQSQAMVLTVTPLGVIATPNAASMLYGEAIPALSGGLSGVLAQDAGKVTASFSTGAGMLAPVGTYPITAALTGSAAGNYTVSVTPANLTIAQAPTLTMLSASNGVPVAGTPVTLTVQAASTTSGVPTGSVTMLDGATALAAVPLSAGGAVWTTSALVQGAHALSVSYSGDANFLPSVSTGTSVTVGAASDFTLAPTGAATQSVPAGSAATFNFSVAMQGAALASPITLAVQGAPVGATVALNPSTLPPGGTVTAFVLTVQTPLAGVEPRSRPFGQPGGSEALFALLVLPAASLARRARPRLRAVLMLGLGVLAATLAMGCGDRIHTAPELVHAKTYTLTVTGTATSPAGTALQHSAVVTLQVLQ